MGWSVTDFLQYSVVKEAWNAARKQVPFITSVTLNLTAIEAQRQVQQGLPSRFTIRSQRVAKGIRMTPSTKRSLTAAVGSLDDFMVDQELGGTKRPQRGAKVLAIPRLQEGGSGRSPVVRRGGGGAIPKRLKPGALLARGAGRGDGKATSGGKALRSPIGLSPGKERAFYRVFSDGRAAELLVHRGREPGKRAIHPLGPTGRRDRQRPAKIPQVARRSFRFAYTFSRAAVIHARWGLGPQVIHIVRRDFVTIFQSSARYIWEREGVPLRFS